MRVGYLVLSVGREAYPLVTQSCPPRVATAGSCTHESCPPAHTWILDHSKTSFSAARFVASVPCYVQTAEPAFSIIIYSMPQHFAIQLIASLRILCTRAAWRWKRFIMLLFR
ncbi:hypothetical protein M404DRAFT_998097 [Pisolithus tinctorius Marx 270]|uniref:Uncharacterized protein n=1 Tax=Pisolithus tinctorius Marx 270 TaxID=870435 RepID=A0A0C3KCM7_PISTI|nr:hypothetical protein M404DRAFT_998097 [Pisolithus tinctorius Marx 270]